MKKLKIEQGGYFSKYFEDLDEAIEYIADYEGEDIFNDNVNEAYDPVEILGYSYSPAESLKAVDPIAYRCAVADFMDSVKEDWMHEAEQQLDEEGEAEICGYSLRWVDEEEGGAVA